jgi:subtilisin family serine protease
MNIQGAWQRGITGYGVNVVHIDDGIDSRHRDLRYNFNRRRT